MLDHQECQQGTDAPTVEVHQLDLAGLPELWTRSDITAPTTRADGAPTIGRLTQSCSVTHLVIPFFHKMVEKRERMPLVIWSSAV